MVFSSLTFLLLFLPIFYIFHFASGRPAWRNGVLTVFSLLFYAWGEPVWILAMLFSTAVNFFAARIIERTEDHKARKLILAADITVSLAFLFYFKYYAFLTGSLAALLGVSCELPSPQLPLGISFYSFQILTYTIDVYRGKAKALDRPLPLLLYVSCFPQLIVGPIIQYSDIAAQLESRTVTADDFSAGIRRFISGLAKKVLLANICAAALEELSPAGAGAMSFCGAWFAAFLYTLQLYFDFSAYSDMAIGLGRTIGFTYKENFNYPYVSASITEFWRRWHISLGSFFRDYIYIPMGGNRRGDRRTAFNMLVVWTLTGLWHGASWNFVAWGAYYGMLLLLERFVLKSFLEKVPLWVRRVITFVIVVIGWVLFRYTDFSQVGQHLAALFGMDVSGAAVKAAAFTDSVTVSVLRKYTVYPLLAFVLSLPVVPTLRGRLERCLPDGRGEKAVLVLGNVFSVVLLALSLVFLIGQSYNPFVYFRF